MFTLNRAWLEGQVIGFVTEHVRAVIEGGRFDHILDEVLTAQRQHTQRHAATVDPVRLLAQLSQERDRLVEAIAEGTLTKAEAGAHLERLRGEIAEAERSRDQSRFAARRQGLSVREREALKRMALDFPQRLARADLATALELLAFWVAAIYADSRERTGGIVLRRAPTVGFERLATASEAAPAARETRAPRRRARCRAERAVGRRTAW